MAINCDHTGESVYCRGDVGLREGNGVYSQARAYVCSYHPGGKVLDLGCSDMVATTQLIKLGYDVIGLDLCRTALSQARSNTIDFKLVNADIIRLPFAQNDTVGTVLLLDVIEHLRDVREAIGVIKDILTRFSRKDLTLIASMPIITFSLPCIREGLSAFVKGRPCTGLFDRTHNILLNRDSQRTLFRNAGLRIVEESQTLCVPSRKTLPHGLYRFVSLKVLPAALHPLSSALREQAMHDINIYQGVYVMKRAGEELTT